MNNLYRIQQSLHTKKQQHLLWCIPIEEIIGLWESDVRCKEGGGWGGVMGSVGLWWVVVSCLTGDEIIKFSESEME